MPVDVVVACHFTHGAFATKAPRCRTVLKQRLSQRVASSPPAAGTQPLIPQQDAGKNLRLIQVNKWSTRESLFAASQNSLLDLEHGLNGVIVSSNRRDREHHAAVEQLVTQGWQDLDRLYGRTLVLLFRATATSELFTPERMRAWTRRFFAAGGVRQVSPRPIVDFLEAVRVMRKTKKGRKAAAVMNRKLIGSMVNRIFDWAVAEICDNRGSESSRGSSAAEQQAEDGGSSSRQEDEDAGIEGPHYVGQARYIQYKLKLGQLGRLDNMPLRKIYTLYRVLRELGLRLTSRQAVALGRAVKMRLEEGQFDWRQMIYIMTVWSFMERRFLRGKNGESGRHPPGYPGADVMETVINAVHAHRGTITAGGLAEFLHSVRVLNDVPEVQMLSDILEELSSKVAGQPYSILERALQALTRLGVDPGEDFVNLCWERVVEDGGANQRWLISVAWSMAVLKRLSPEQWKAVVSLEGPDEKQMMDGAFIMRVRLQRWLTIYLLMREQYDQQPPQHAQQDGHGGRSTEVQESTESGGKEGSSGAGSESGAASRVVPLPPKLMERCLAAQRRACLVSASPTIYPVPAAMAEVLRDLCQGRYEVRERYTIEDPVTGAPLLVDVAIPSLKLAFQAIDVSEHRRHTQVPSVMVLVRNRLMRLYGWEHVVVLPSPVLRGVMKAVGGEEEQQQQEQEENEEKLNKKKHSWSHRIDYRPVIYSLLKKQPGLLKRLRGEES